MAFYGCSHLTNVTIPETLVHIGCQAFVCGYPLHVYFEGGPDSLADAGECYPRLPFSGATYYYIPGTAGWESLASQPGTEVWRPTLDSSCGTLGADAAPFGFTVTWARNRVVVAEASSNLANPDWTPIRTNALTDGLAYITDPEWTNHPARFYRVRGQ